MRSGIQPIPLFQGVPMRKSATELGVAPLLLGEADEAKARKLAKADQAMPPSTVRWIAQPVSFGRLKSYQNPFHTRAIRLKSRMTAGLGFVEDPERGELALPKSARGDTFKSQLQLAALDTEHTGNGYLEVIMATGGRIASVTWLPAETMEISADQAWYRHTASDPGSANRRVVYYPAWPRDGAPKPGTRYCLHVYQDGTWSTWYGEPDWLGCLPDVMLFDSAMAYNRAMFDNNCIPTWLIMLVGAKLSDEKPEDPNNAGHYLPSQREEFVSWLQQTYGGAQNNGKAMLLDGFEVAGGDKSQVVFQKLQDGPKDGDFLKLLDTCRDHILSCHGVPPRLAGVVTSGSLGGSGEMFGQLISFAEDLKPKRETWDAALAMLQPYLGVASLTLNPLDIEPWREVGQQTPPTVPAKNAQEILRQAEAMLQRGRA